MKVAVTVPSGQYGDSFLYSIISAMNPVSRNMRRIERSHFVIRSSFLPVTDFSMLKLRKSDFFGDQSAAMAIKHLSVIIKFCEI